jgi:hypothetical protein
MVCGEIRLSGIAVVRIHASGDFYSPAHVAEWAEIARRNPRTTFYAYTRSWRKVRLRLLKPATLANVWLWYSEDAETGPAPRDPGIRHASMLLDDAQAATIHPGGDMLFRDQPRTPAMARLHDERRDMASTAW